MAKLVKIDLSPPPPHCKDCPFYSLLIFFSVLPTVPVFYMPFTILLNIEVLWPVLQRPLHGSALSKECARCVMCVTPLCSTCTGCVTSAVLLFALTATRPGSKPQREMVSTVNMHIFTSAWQNLWEVRSPGQHQAYFHVDQWSSLGLTCLDCM